MMKKELVEEFFFILWNIDCFTSRPEYLQKQVSIYYYFLDKIKIYKEKNGDLMELKNEILKNLNKKKKLSEKQNDLLGDILDDISGNSNSL